MHTEPLTKPTEAAVLSTEQREAIKAYLDLYHEVAAAEQKLHSLQADLSQANKTVSKQMAKYFDAVYHANKQPAPFELILTSEAATYLLTFEEDFDMKTPYAGISEVKPLSNPIAL